LKFDNQTHLLYGPGCKAMAGMIRAWMEGAEHVAAWQLNMIAATMTGNAHTTNLLGSWLGSSQWGDRHGYPASSVAEIGPAFPRTVEAIPAANEPVLQSVKKGANGSPSPYPVEDSMVQKPRRVPLILVRRATSASAGRALGKRIRTNSAQE